MTDTEGPRRAVIAWHVLNTVLLVQGFELIYNRFWEGFSWLTSSLSEVCQAGIRMWSLSLMMCPAEYSAIYHMTGLWNSRTARSEDKTTWHRFHRNCCLWNDMRCRKSNQCLYCISSRNTTDYTEVYTGNNSMCCCVMPLHHNNFTRDKNQVTQNARILDFYIIYQQTLEIPAMQISDPSSNTTHKETIPMLLILTCKPNRQSGCLHINTFKKINAFKYTVHNIWIEFIYAIHVHAMWSILLQLLILDTISPYTHKHRLFNINTHNKCQHVTFKFYLYIYLYICVCVCVCVDI